MEQAFKKLLGDVHGILKPLGYKKDGANFRYYGQNGLCRIINFQRNQWNSRDHLEFVINTGSYFEKNIQVENQRFKEYECALRGRVFPEDGAFWWVLEASTDRASLWESVRAAIQRALADFDTVPNRESVIEAIRAPDGDLYRRVSLTWARLLADMGYGARVYARIRDANPIYLRKLAEELRASGAVSD